MSDSSGDSPRIGHRRRPPSPNSDDDELFEAARSLSTFRATPRTVQQQRHTSSYSQQALPSSSAHHNTEPPAPYQQAGPPTPHQHPGSSSTAYDAAPHTSSRTGYPATHGSHDATARADRPSDKSSKKKSSSSRTKEKEKEKHKSSSSSSRKHRNQDTGQPSAHSPHKTASGSHTRAPSQYPMPQPPIPGTQTAFRVEKYVNDPRAGPSPVPQTLKGPYTADFRATPPGYKGDTPSASGYRTPTHDTPGTTYGGPTPPIEEPRRSYYRHDYDKQRKPPAYAHPSGHHSSAPPPSSPPYTHPEHHRDAPPPRDHYHDTFAPSPPLEDYRRSPPPARSEYRREPPPPPQSSSTYTYPAPVPPPHHDYRRHEPPPSYRPEPSPPPIPEPAPRHRYSSPERRHRSRPHRHEREPYLDNGYNSRSSPPPPPRSPEPYHRDPEPTHTRSSDRPPPVHMKAPRPMRAGSREPADARTLRTVTLLIEDQRQLVGDEPIQMIGEVRVPIKSAKRPEDGYYADAREVSEGLQTGPSRLDGRAKVYAFRGRYRHYFLRVTPESGIECHPANLVVDPDLTLKLFVEEYPLANAASLGENKGKNRASISAHGSYERKPLSPVVDSMPTPASLPPPARGASPLSHHSSPIRHSRPPVAPETPSAPPQYYESDPPPRKQKKRPRESSTRSSMVDYPHPPPPDPPYIPEAPPRRDDRAEPRYPPPSGYDSGGTMPTVAPSPPRSRYSPGSASRSPPPPMSPASRHSPPSPGRFTPTPVPSQPPPRTEYPQYQSDTGPLPGPPSPKKARRDESYEPRPQPSHASESGPRYRRVSSVQETPPSAPYDPASAYAQPAGTSYPSTQGAMLPPSTSYPPATAYPAPYQPSTVPDRPPSTTYTTPMEPMQPPSSSYPPSAGPIAPSTTYYPPNPGPANTLPPGVPYPSVPASMPPIAEIPSAAPPPPIIAYTPGAGPAVTQADRPSSNVPLTGNTPTAPAREKTPEYSDEVNKAVGMYLRGVFSCEPGWEEFKNGRNSRLKMSQQLEQYRFVKGKLEKYVGTKTPADVTSAPGISITKVQVMKAFNQPVSWLEEGSEVLALTGMYGPNGKRHEDPRVGAMLEEVPPTTTGIQLKKFLALLREIHSRWTMDNPDF